LITDERSTEPIPDWSSEEQQVTATATAMVVKVRHEVDGAATVRVWDAVPPNAGVVDLETVSLKSPSGVLRVSTATGEHAVKIPVPGGTARVKVLTSSPRDPDEIDLVVLPGSSERARRPASAPVRG
jgi:hypothetical protein